MKKTLYLMRHGQTLFNARRKIQGNIDSPLTELGKKQAEIAKQYFSENNIILTHAYSSTQERASDTLEIITNLPYKRLKGLKEMGFGIFEGESEDFHPPVLGNGNIFGEFYASVGGEGETSLRERMVQTLTEIMEKEDHRSVLAVSHGIACFTFFSKWHPEIYLEGVPNCTVFKYEYRDGKFNNLEIFRPDFSRL